MSDEGAGGRALTAYVNRQIEVLLGSEERLRAVEPDAVHQTRVATRRLRSILRVFEPLPGKKLGRELRWFARALAAPRDAEVIESRLLGHCDTLGLGGIGRKRLAAALAARTSAAVAALHDELATPEFARLEERLRAVRDKGSLGGGRSRAAFALRLVAADETVAWGYARALATPEPERMHELHETRKAAKRARYAAEALADAFGEPAKNLAAAWEGVTDSLGLVQDSATSLEVIAELRAGAGRHLSLRRILDKLAAHERELVAAEEDDSAAALAAAAEASRRFSAAAVS